MAYTRGWTANWKVHVVPQPVYFIMLLYLLGMGHEISFLHSVICHIFQDDQNLLETPDQYEFDSVDLTWGQ